MSINFKEVVLNNYGGFKLKADVDENPEDIIAAVCYCDHGDHFLIIKTKDACYEYGLFVTRNGWDARCLNDETHYQRRRFVKMPKLTGPIDLNSNVANDIYFLIRDYTKIKGGMFESDKIHIHRDKIYAQMDFDILHDRLKEIYETGTVYADHADSYVSDILAYLTANDILTEENLQRIEEIKLFLRKDAISGSAGKINHDGIIYGDNLDWIWYKGEKVTKKYHKHGIKVKRNHSDDEWGGYDGFYVNMKQFM